jgi:limonene 1,2-monooxygenase
MLGIDPATQRDRQDEAIGVIKRLLAGEVVSHESDWFTLRDAQLQILPLQEQMPMAAASSLSPSGMTLAGKHSMGVLSIASTSSEGLQALPTQWSFAEEAAAVHGGVADRSQWRILMSFHIAETREQARAEAVDGLQRWHNEYNVKILGRPNAVHVEDKWELLAQTADAPGSASVIGTPDDLVNAIRDLYEVTGGFGTVIGFAHDWANRENTFRSWELVARYVIPEVNGQLRKLRTSAQFLIDRQRDLMGGASAAVMQKILGNEKAAAALAVTMQQQQQANQAWRPGAAPEAAGAAAGE